MTEREQPTDRTRVRRLPERGAYDRATIDAILDAMPVAHVGYSIDGQPFVTPTLQWREGDHVYLVDKKGERHIPVHGKIGFPYFGELILDCLQRTERSMPQSHAFLAIELALSAQLSAVKIA